ncbi:uncharacterized protein LOC62_04G005449 [Vanrija pseudolonga]|uniref:Uncharacterized protein n=1 Tax=Vanrija pseudolonga TaxID=143232 RepID=A0AAF0Y8M1_9TREE|nr:hypothetical protein LOC62_04G005449 [Vanrija pseudolonga]
MNAIRSLPLINKQARPATPVQSSVAVSGSAAVQPLGPPPVPASRVATPAAAPGGLAAPKKNTSPTGSRPATPRNSVVGLPGSGPETPQGGYMDAIGLRLADTVNKSCSGIDFKAKKGARKGAGWTIGEGIAKELPPPPADTYLLRAVLRTVVRSLAIYINRLDSLLMPALSDAQWSAAFNLTSTITPLNPTQLFAVSIAHTAWETCEKLEQVLETTAYPRFVEDTLRPSMDKLDFIVSKVVRPILLAVKLDLEGSLSRTDGVAHKSPSGPSTIPLADVPVTKTLSNPPTARVTKEPSGSGHPRSITVPCCLQQFASRVDGARKVFETVAKPCEHDGEGWVAKVVVSVVWKGMRLIGENEPCAPLSRTPSPTHIAKALTEVKDKEGRPTVAPSPSLAKITQLSILPSRAASRAPSPPRGPAHDPVTHALLSFEGLMKRLVGGLVQPPTAAPTAVDSSDQEAEHIAREAVFEAIEALESAVIGSAALHGPNGAERTLASVRRLRDDIDNEEDEKLDDALEDLPSVSLFSAIIRRTNVALGHVNYVSEKGGATTLRIREAGEIWGWTKAEYERQVLSGFGPAEEWGPRVAKALKPEVERMLSTLAGITAGEAPKVTKETSDAAEWVRALGVALDARAGVKVVGAT